MRGVIRLAVISLMALTSCVFEAGDDHGEAGFLSLEIGVRSNALAKTAAADTIFDLDSLKIVLSAPGAATTTYTYAISGRSDTGNILVSPKIYSLAPLRTWTARIWTLDTTMNPAKTDTVHLDSVSFAVRAGDTTLVAKTINPVFTILRTRFVSNSPASITNNVKYVRIRVDGVTRDSTLIGPTLRSVAFGSANNGCVVGDSGLILRTTNSGTNWAPMTSGTGRNLNGVAFPGANVGYAVGDSGVILKTTNGTLWTAQTSGTPQPLNGAYFTGNNAGYAVGNSGVILISDGTAWAPAAVSATTNNLNGVYFSSATTGYAVGNSGAIVKTTNRGVNWSVLAGGTARNLNAVHFPVAATGFVVGDSGTILKTVNNGTAWVAQTSGTTHRLTGVFFQNATTGWAVGDGGTLLTTTNGTTWSALAGGTTQPLYGIQFNTNNSAAVAVGRLGTALRTTDGTAWSFQAIGAKSFDVLLAYKYLRPNIAHTLILDAIDTLTGPLRGYQAVTSVTISPGKDTTITPASALAKCGYAGFPGCSP